MDLTKVCYAAYLITVYPCHGLVILPVDAILDIDAPRNYIKDDVSVMACSGDCSC